MVSEWSEHSKLIFSIENKNQDLKNNVPKNLNCRKKVKVRIWDINNSDFWKINFFRLTFFDKKIQKIVLRKTLSALVLPHGNRIREIINYPKVKGRLEKDGEEEEEEEEENDDKDLGFTWLGWYMMWISGIPQVLFLLCKVLRKIENIEISNSFGYEIDLRWIVFLKNIWKTLIWSF